MRVTVFGTSNSLMERGWLNLMAPEAESRAIRLENRSVGGSSSRYGAFLTATHGAVGRKGFILYDYAIPDQMFLKAGWLADEDILGHYLAIAQSLIASGSLHRALVLLLPHQEDLVESAILDRIAALLTELGLPYIDFRPVLAGIMAETGLSADDLYLDPRHFVPDIQAKIGAHVLARLKPARAPWRLRPAARKLRKLPSAGYRALETGPLPGQGEAGRARVCGTRLISMPVLELHEGEGLRLAGAKYLAGALIWTQENSGSLAIRGGEAGIRLHLRRLYKDIFLFESLTETLELGDEAELRVANPTELPSQRTLGLSTTTYDRAGATCEIALLVGCDIAPRDFLRRFDATREQPSLGRRILRRLRRSLR